MTSALLRHLWRTRPIEIVYSNADLEAFSPASLYRRPTVAQVGELLEGLT